MVLFNAPMPVENHELQAIRMALAMRETLTAVSLSWRKRGHELGFGAGIAGGYVHRHYRFRATARLRCHRSSMQSGCSPLW